MRTTEQKLIDLLNRIGWRITDNGNSGYPDIEVLNPNFENDNIPLISHDLMDEVWEWMRGLCDQQDLLWKYGQALWQQLRATGHKGSSASESIDHIAHLSAEQKFEAACKALGIE